jgi:peptidoglycan/xylan/chitin deacetylase (PgdA/CDA1 family)
VLVLSYHNIVESVDAVRGDRSLHLPQDRFVAQLDVLAELVTVVPLASLLSSDDPTRIRVAITFDDAYEGALAHGVRACVQRGLPCTVFVAPGLLGRVPYWDRQAEAGRWSAPERERFLTAQRGIDPEPECEVPSGLGAQRIAGVPQLREASEWPGVSFGNHSHDHANLAVLSATEVASQLERAWRWLNSEVPAALVPVVAYPYGLAPHDLAALQNVPGTAFGLCVTGGWLPAYQPAAHGTRRALSLPRWNVPAGISVPGFRARLRGFLAR